MMCICDSWHWNWSASLACVRTFAPWGIVNGRRYENRRIQTKYDSAEIDIRANRTKRQPHVGPSFNVSEPNRKMTQGRGDKQMDMVLQQANKMWSQWDVDGPKARTHTIKYDIYILHSAKYRVSSLFIWFIGRSSIYSCEQRHVFGIAFLQMSVILIRIVRISWRFSVIVGKRDVTVCVWSPFGRR